MSDQFETMIAELESEDSEDALPDLTGQRRNLGLLTPIFTLDDRKNHFQRQWDFSRIDMKYLSLALIEHVSARMAVDHGATRPDMTERLAAIVPKMDPALDGAAAMDCAEAVIDRLMNQAERGAEFSETYFDAANTNLRGRQYRLFRSEQIDGTIYYRVTPEAVTVHLAMLQVDFLDEKTARLMMLQDNVNKGRYDRARRDADQSLRRTVQFRREIEALIRRVRRNTMDVSWATQAIPMLHEARDHITESMDREGSILSTLKEQLDNLTTDGLKNRQAIVAIMTTLEFCHEAHIALHRDVMAANLEFLDLQAAAFRIRKPAAVPDLEADLLPALLATPVADLADASDQTTGMLGLCDVPRLLHLPYLFDALMETGTLGAEAPVVEEEELDEVEPLPDLWSADDLLGLRAFITETLSAAGPTRMSELLDAARARYHSDRMVRGLAFLLMESVHQNGEGLIILGRDGLFSNAVGQGDDLIYGLASQAQGTEAAPGGAPTDTSDISASMAA